MQSPNNICLGCDHFAANNNDGLIRGCRAFPNGIPYKYGLGKQNFHDYILEEQDNDYVYTPAKNGLNIAAKNISIIQKSNLNADEEGKSIQ